MANEITAGEDQQCDKGFRPLQAKNAFVDFEHVFQVRENSFLRICQIKYKFKHNCSKLTHLQNGKATHIF